MGQACLERGSQTRRLAGVYGVRLGAGEGAVSRPSGTGSRMDLSWAMGENPVHGENRSDRR